MGNSVCCQEMPIHQSEPIIVHKREDIVIPELPTLSQPILAHLEKERPFENDLPLRPSIKKYGDDIYEGSVDDVGRPDGFGKMYYKNGSIFIGEFQSGIANGKGHYVQPDATFYHGKMENNKANDENGYFCSGDFVYKGSIIDNKFHGEGQEADPLHSFTGEYYENKKVRGKLVWKDEGGQNRYEGGFNKDEKFEGDGLLIQQQKGEYIGQFFNGQKHGKGEYRYPSGLKYVGEYKYGIREGLGKIFNKQSNIAYDGQWKNGLPHGKGSAPNSKNQLMEKDWIDGIDSDLLDI